MGRLIIDGSMFNCDLKINSQSQPIYITGNQNPYFQSNITTNEVKFSIPFNNTNQQILDNHFNNNYRVGLVSNYKKDLIYIMNDNNGYYIYGFYVTELSHSCDSFGNSYIDVEGQCDHFNVVINLIDDEYKRMLRKKKLERILND